MSVEILIIIIIIIIMFIYSNDDIMRNLQKQHPPCRAALYIKGLSSSKLLPHYCTQRLITAPA